MDTSVEELVAPLSSVAPSLRILGVWVPPPGRRWKHRAALTLVLAVHVFLLVTSNGSLIMETPPDLPTISFIAYNCLTFIGITAKLVSIALDGPRLLELLSLLVEARRRFPDAQGRRAHYQAAAVRLHRYLKMGFRTNSSFWCIGPLISIAIASATGSAAAKNFPIPLWLPFDTHSSPAYEILYCIQVPCGWFQSETTIAMDSTLFALMLHAVAELAVLDDNVNSSTAAGFRDCESTKQDKPSYYKNHGWQAEGDVFSRLVDNIKHHQIILAYVSLLQKLMTRATSVLLVCNTLSICLHIIAMASLLQEDIEPVQMSMMVLGSTLYAYQIGIQCLLGQKITNESERLSQTVFSSDWTDADRSYKQLVLFFGQYSSQQLSLKICSLYTLSAKTLVQVLNVSYSLFNFMYQTVSSEN